MRLKAEKEKETPTDLVRAALEKEVLANKKTTTFDDESEEEESEEESSEEESEDEEEQEQEEKVEEEKKADDVEAEEAKEEEVEEDKADNIPAASEPTATTKASKKDAVRTKYDRMFERKNQSVLTSHYTAMISHDDGADGDDDFLKIEKRDHTLNDVGLESLGVDLTSSIDGRSTSSTPAIPSTIELSKRKLKMGESKKQMLKLKGTGHKVTFDDEGQAHEVYEMEDLDDFEGKGDAKSQQAAYVKEELERMKEADVVDRQVAREKRQEKKRKRKQAERDVSNLPSLDPILRDFQVLTVTFFIFRCDNRLWLRKWKKVAWLSWVVTLTMRKKEKESGTRRKSSPHRSPSPRLSVVVWSLPSRMKTMKRNWLCGCFEANKWEFLPFILLYKSMRIILINASIAHPSAQHLFSPFPPPPLPSLPPNKQDPVSYLRHTVESLTFIR